MLRFLRRSLDNGLEKDGRGVNPLCKEKRAPVSAQPRRFVRVFNNDKLIEQPHSLVTHHAADQWVRVRGRGMAMAQGNDDVSPLPINGSAVVVFYSTKTKHTEFTISRRHHHPGVG